MTQVKTEDSITPPESPNVYSPLFGISNAYFLSNNQQSSKVSPVKNLKDIPNLLSQVPLSPSLLPNLPQLAAKPKPDFQSAASRLVDAAILSNAPVRRYKQYTEDTLRQALKDIVNGQSINR